MKREATLGGEPVINAMAELVANPDAKVLPADARERIVDHLMDTLGVGLAGRVEEGGRMVVALAQSGGGVGQAHVLGTGEPLSSWDAAWVNGVLTNLLDFDDTGFTHPSVCVVPSALAVAEVADLGGDGLMRALAVGYEICARLASVIGGVHNATMRQRGLHPMAVCGAIAAAASAGAAVGLTVSEARVAFGLAAASSFGITEHFGTWAKAVHAGNAARAGVQATLLAAEGFVASQTAVEGRLGMLNALLGPGNYTLEAGRREADAPWAIVDPGAEMKLYPACGGTRVLIESALALRRRLGEVARLDRLVIRVPERLLDTLRFDWPRTGFEGKFSVRFPVAVALLDGQVAIESFTDASLARPRLQALMHRIEIVPTPGGYEHRARHDMPMRAHTTEGQILDQAANPTPRGTRGNRLAREEVVEKFLSCAGRVLHADRARVAVDVVASFGDVPVRELVSALTEPGGS